MVPVNHKQDASRKRQLSALLTPRKMFTAVWRALLPVGTDQKLGRSEHPRPGYTAYSNAAPLWNEDRSLLVSVFSSLIGNNRLASKDDGEDTVK